MTTEPERATTFDARLRGRWLLVARVAWVTVTVLVVGLSVVGMPEYYDQLRTLSDPNVETPIATHANYAAYNVALGVVYVAVNVAVGALIFWRKSDEPVALLVALMLVLLSADGSPIIEALVVDHLIVGWVAECLNFASGVCLLLFVYLFPDGRFVPRLSRWLMVFWIGLGVASSYGPDPFGSLVAFGVFGSGVFAQVYRYLRVSGPVQRQQTRWVVFGFAVAIMGFLVTITLPTFFPTLDRQGPLDDLIGDTIISLFLLLIPLSIGVAILRSRLFDIDVIINRTLVYGTLTFTLILVYAGSVVSLQYVFRTLTGGSSQLVIVASTLAIAALFNPLRWRVQAGIDRLFYRKKYDAAKTLEAYSARLRDETDLDTLNEDLASVVDETLQPAHVSLWLRETGR